MPTESEDRIWLADNDVIGKVFDEIQSARAKFPAINSVHEGYAVILEEFDEFWDEVKAKQDMRSKQKMRAELIQVAAMCIRTIVDVIGSE